jgi:hypothetical protein
MAIFPKIQSPCPYKNELATLMDGDMCRACHRQVVDLDGFSDSARVAFLAACKSEVCVSYSFPLRPAIAAALTAAALGAPMSAAAQEAPDDFIEIIVGGILTPSDVEFISAEQDLVAPDAQVIYEDETDEASSKPLAVAANDEEQL